MAWWVYKCNSRNREYQNAYGDWDEFFDDPEEHWGKSEWVPELARLKMGDYITISSPIRRIETRSLGSREFVSHASRTAAFT